MILGNSQKKRSKNRFVSLLVLGVLLGFGVGVPIQIFQMQSAEAAVPRSDYISGATSGCINMSISYADPRHNITSWKYSYDGIFIRSFLEL